MSFKTTLYLAVALLSLGAFYFITQARLGAVEESVEGSRPYGQSPVSREFLKDKLGSVVVALAAVVDGAPILVTMVTPDLVARGLHAGDIARDTAKVMGGGGGGRPEMAQAGGKLPEKVDEALSGVPALVRRGLS